MTKQLFIFFVLTDCTPATFTPPHYSLQKTCSTYPCTYLRTKLKNTIINYCEMCSVFVFHPPLPRHLVRNTATGRPSTWSLPQNLKGLVLQPLRSVTRRHVVCLSLHYSVISGDVKCNGACMIRSCSWAKIQLYCGRKRRSHGHRGCCFNIYYL